MASINTNEEEIYNFWTKNDIFKKLVKKNKKNNKFFNFYDGFSFSLGVFSLWTFL